MCQNVISKMFLCNFIESILRHECSPANLLHNFRTPFPENNSGGLLLKQENKSSVWCYMTNCNLRNVISRGLATGERRAAMALKSTSEPNKVQQFQFQSSGIFLFNGRSEIIRTRNLTIFAVYGTSFEQFTAAFYFF